MKNKKNRGVSFLETVLVVTLLGVVVSIAGPTIRNFLKIGELTTGYGIEEEIKFVSDQIQGVLDTTTVSSNQGGWKFGVTGMTVAATADKTKGIIPLYKMSNVSPGKALYLMQPLLSNPAKGTQELVQAYHAFVFEDNKLMHYTTVDDENYGAKLKNSDNIFGMGVAELFPRNTANSNIKVDVTKSSFENGRDGAYMTIVYKDGNGGEKTIKRFFKKRGEA